MLAALLKQNITSRAATPSARGGYTYGTPVALIGRWEDKSEVFFDPTGNQLVSRAIVYLTTLVYAEDYLYLGTSVAANPTAATGAQRVRMVQAAPSLDVSQTLYKVFM